MEGVSGVIHWDDVSETGRDYGLFRRLMTEETNAAIEGALAPGKILKNPPLSSLVRTGSRGISFLSSS